MEEKKKERKKVARQQRDGNDALGLFRLMRSEEVVGVMEMESGYMKPCV